MKYLVTKAMFAPGPNSPGCCFKVETWDGQLLGFVPAKPKSVYRWIHRPPTKRERERAIELLALGA